MNRLFFVVLLALTSQLLFACEQDENLVTIETEYGNITILLYDETPVHKENFIKLCKEGFYDGLLFHRVIKDFMIQGGDPASRNATSNASLGAGGTDYNLKAEIYYPQYFHKKGALAAARQGDQVNPLKESSGSQFYLVQGRIYSNEELDQIENMKTDRLRQQVFMKYAEPFRNELVELQEANMREEFMELIQKVEQLAAQEINEIEPSSLPEEHRKAYTGIGGTPHLDGEYTVFGEVIKGLEVIDKIAELEVNNADRPTNDVIMTIKIGAK